MHARSTALETLYKMTFLVLVRANHFILSAISLPSYRNKLLEMDATGSHTDAALCRTPGDGDMDASANIATPTASSGAMEECATELTVIEFYCSQPAAGEFHDEFECVDVHQ